MTPTERQVLGARVRAAFDQWILDHGTPGEGGVHLPSRQERDAYLCNLFDMEVHEVHQFLTYSRKCDHPWSEGACSKCPK